MLDFNNVNFEANDIIDKVNKNKVRSKDIAIIGMAFKLPMANNIQELWNNVRNGVDCITHISDERKMDISNYCRYIGLEPQFAEMGYMDDIDKFDYKFFNLSPKEACLMDPNQRLFLEIAWQAIEDSGYGGKMLVGSRTGVYLGYSNPAMDYMDIVLNTNPSLSPLAVNGNMNSMIPSRIGYFMDFRGPSICIDTACSSSLVALHNACRGIQTGECNIAIAGATEAVLFPMKNESSTGIESKTYRTKAFDDEADGTGVGEGVVALVLKPLTKAIKDRDNIYAVIKGSAINQDGNSIGITAPNSVAQEDVIICAWTDADIDPETISYIETHGTATSLGDPIEIDGITRAFRKFTSRKQFCAIGALKSNIGHLGGAAGIAGVIKAVISLKNSEIAPVVHLKMPNRKIDFENSPVYVNDVLKKWDTGSEPKRCGVSSFGLSGTNCHVILEEAPSFEPRKKERHTAPYSILTISAKTESSLRTFVEKYLDMLNNDNDIDIDIEDMCFTANTGRGHNQLRLALIIENKTDLIQLLKKVHSDFYWNIDDEKIYITQFLNKQKHSGSKEDEQVTHSCEQVNMRISYLLKEDKSNKAILNQICQLYVKGADIDWKQLYTEEQRRRIRIPVYPFDKTKCWVPIPEGIKVQQTIKCETETNQHTVKLNGGEDGKYSKIERLLANSWGEALGYKELDINENYYSMGGDSVIGIQIINDLNKKLDMNVNITDLLLSMTIAKMAKKISNRIHEDIKKEFLTIPKSIEMPYYQLSSAQKRMFITDVLEGASTAYNIYGALIIEGNLDINKVQNTMDRIIERHESFRTSFDLVNGEAVQIVHSDIKLDVIVEKISENEVKDKFRDFIKPFDLKTAPLIRSKILEINKNKNVFMFDMHHIISDGYSMGIFVDEFMKIYKGYELPEIKINYRDFAVWQNKYIESEEINNQGKYWLDIFSEEIPVLDLPRDFPLTSTKEYKGENINFEIKPELTAKIIELAKSSNTTIFNILLATYNILLMKLTEQNDIVIGSASAGRQNTDCENIIGMFVNMLALRNYPDEEKRFSEFLNEVTQNSLKAFDNQGFQYTKLIDKLGIEGGASKGALFDTVFTLQNIKIKDFQIEDFKITGVEYENNQSPYPVSLIIVDNKSKLDASFEYQTSVFKKSTIENMAKNYIEILTQVVKDDSTQLKSISLSNQYITIVTNLIREEELEFDF